ncbi:hypothetical protein BC834DRAFT_442485 [Gloeopeniophorella convolvens]|nr:hypothetical protein BC834DRAFT_442485 [Gloeopeniophorella convolvens]
MAYDTHVRRGHPIFFTLLVVFAIIELAISAWLTARYNSRHDYLSKTERDRVEFLLFCSIWTVFLSPFLAASFLFASGSVLASVASHVIFLFLTWVFWLSGAAAITDSLGGGLNCDDHFVYCGQLNALEAFAWIEWVLLTLGFVFITWVAVRASRRGDGYGGPLIAA